MNVRTALAVKRLMSKSLLRRDREASRYAKSTYLSFDFRMDGREMRSLISRSR